jgi:hypothetical protein
MTRRLPGVVLALALACACNGPAPTRVGTRLLSFDVGATLDSTVEARLATAVPAPHAATVTFGEGSRKAVVSLRYTTATDPATADRYVQRLDAELTKNDGSELALRVAPRASSLPIKTPDGHKAWPVEIVASYDCSTLLSKDTGSGTWVWLYGDGSKKDYVP